MQRMRKCQGQGTLEYLLVLTALIAAIIAGAAAIRGAMGNAFNAAGARVTSAAGKFGD